MLPPFPVNYGGVYGAYAPPVMGGTEAVMYYSFTYATPAASTAFVLPAGATIVSFGLLI